MNSPSKLPALRPLPTIALGAAAVFLTWRALRAKSRFDLRGKVALITGGSRGLGLVLARQLTDKGATTVICARDPGEVARAVEELSLRGGQVTGRVADLVECRQAEDMITAIEQRYGRLDVVINNAGIIQVGPLESMSLADFHSAMANNFWSAVHVVAAALPLLKRAGKSRIVNIASIGGKIGVPHLIPYCASKFALVGYSQGLRAELAKDGVSVTTVCPGLMRTGSHGNAMFKGRHDAEYSWFSISGSMPLLTMSAEQAAAEILAALERGDAEVILTLAARWATLANQLAPSLMSAVCAAANRFLLPKATGQTVTRRGFECESPVAPSILTRLNESAAERNNELPVAEVISH